jgi:Uma2 family endonuclease
MKGGMVMATEALALPQEQIERLNELTKNHVDYKWELIDGIVTLLMPGVPEHGLANGNINFKLSSILRGKDCKIFAEGMKFHFTEKDRFIPDIAVVCKPLEYRDGAVDVVPDLVVETLSPRTASYDRNHKLRIYGIAGVKECWIVDIKNFSVEIYLNQGGKMELYDTFIVFPQYEIEESKAEGRELPPTGFVSPTFPELHIELSEIFEYIIPEDY